MQLPNGVTMPENQQGSYVPPRPPPGLAAATSPSTPPYGAPTASAASGVTPGGHPYPPAGYGAPPPSHHPGGPSYASAPATSPAYANAAPHHAHADPNSYHHAAPSYGGPAPPPPGHHHAVYPQGPPGAHNAGGYGPANYPPGSPPVAYSSSQQAAPPMASPSPLAPPRQVTPWPIARAKLRLYLLTLPLTEMKMLIASVHGNTQKSVVGPNGGGGGGSFAPPTDGLAGILAEVKHEKVARAPWGASSTTATGAAAGVATRPLTAAAAMPGVTSSAYAAFGGSGSAGGRNNTALGSLRPGHSPYGGAPSGSHVASHTTPNVFLVDGGGGAGNHYGGGRGGGGAAVGMGGGAIPSSGYSPTAADASLAVMLADLPL